MRIVRVEKGKQANKPSAYVIIVSSFVTAIALFKLLLGWSWWRDTNDDNHLLLTLLNKQAKWVLFVCTSTYFYLILFLSLLDIMSCMCEWVSFLLSLYLFLASIMSKWSAANSIMECCFEEHMRNYPVTLLIDDDEYVLDSHLSAIDFLSSLSVYIKYNMSIYDLHQCLF
jgi:hypothetical protein